MDDTPIEAGRGLTLVREKDPDFDEGAFVEGARKLYEMILLDFAAGDLTGVKAFLGPDVLAGFEAAIHQREEEGEHLITEIHALARPVIEDAEYDNGVVRLSVRYSADLVSHVSGTGAEEPRRRRCAVAICGFSNAMFSQTAELAADCNLTE